MSDNDDRHIGFLIQFMQQIQDILGCKAIQISCRFVRQNNGRVANHRSRYRNPLPLPA